MHSFVTVSIKMPFALCSRYVPVQRGMYEMRRLGYSIQAASVSLVYRKLLRLNKEQVSSFSAGQITNLISTDIGKFLVMAELPFGPKAVLLLMLCTYLIWDLIGAYALVAVAFPVIMVPIYVIFGSMYGRTRQQVTKMTDWRIKLSGEMLSGMRIIKMYAWERTVHRLIMNYRLKELDLLFKANRLRAVINASFLVLASLGVGVTFIVYQSSGHISSVVYVFATMAYLQSLKIEFGFFLPSSLKVFFELKVTCARVQEFLTSPESEQQVIDDNTQQVGPSASEAGALAMTTFDHMHDSQANSRAAVNVANLSFAWVKDRPTLQDISFQVAPGSLLCVVGPVGCGKTTLLNVLMSEVTPQSGSVHVGGSIAYSSQEAWIPTQSLRETVIMFGNGFDEDWYNRVVDACGLVADFNSMPAGDLTEVRIANELTLLTVMCYSVRAGWRARSHTEWRAEGSAVACSCSVLQA
jgi:ATP-binding cassette subfamily C (CFTR/MRP) protein 4